MLTAAEANTRYAISNELVFTAPITEPHAKFLHDLKADAMNADAYLMSASHSAFSFKALAGSAAMLLGIIWSPVEAVLAIVFASMAIRGVVRRWDAIAIGIKRAAYGVSVALAAFLLQPILALSDATFAVVWTVVIIGFIVLAIGVAIGSTILKMLRR